MSARADDRIWWAPPDRCVVAQVSRVGAHVLIHLCPSACTVAPTTRSQLDPMALGTCRYCREPLPVPRESDGA